MIVQLYDVRIPAPTTLFRRVPQYDVPILRRLWQGHLKPDALGNVPVIEVHALGQFEPRSLFNERQRLIREYPVTVDNGEKPVWAEVYPSQGDFDRAYAAEVEAAKLALEPPVAQPSRQAPPAPLAPAGTASPPSLPPAPGQSALFAPPPKRRGRAPKA